MKIKKFFALFFVGRLTHSKPTTNSAMKFNVGLLRVSRPTLALSSLFLVFGTAYADPIPRDSYYSSGYYIGGNIGAGYAHADDIANYDRSENGLTGRLYFGYNINHYLAVDIGYWWLPTVKYTGQGSSTGTDSKINNSALDPTLTGKFPLGEGFSVYGRGGAAMVRSRLTSSTMSDTENGTVLEYGGGLDYVWANVGGLHTLLDYTHMNEHDTNVFNMPSFDLYTIGVYYQF